MKKKSVSEGLIISVLAGFDKEDWPGKRVFKTLVAGKWLQESDLRPWQVQKEQMHHRIEQIRDVLNPEAQIKFGTQAYCLDFSQALVSPGLRVPFLLQSEWRASLAFKRSICSALDMKEQQLKEKKRIMAFCTDFVKKWSEEVCFKEGLLLCQTDPFDKYAGVTLHGTGFILSVSGQGSIRIECFNKEGLAHLHEKNPSFKSLQEAYELKTTIAPKEDSNADFNGTQKPKLSIDEAFKDINHGGGAGP